MWITDTRINIWKLPVLIAVFFGLCLRLALLIVTPIGSESCAGKLSSYNDENAHAQYVKFIIENHRLPNQVESIQEQNALSRGFYEYYQPPLFYMITAGIGWVLGCTSSNSITMISRGLALLCSLMMLWLLNRITGVLQLDSLQRAAVVIFWALNGVLVRFTITGSNDALFWVLSGGMLLASLEYSQPDTPFRFLVLFSCIAIVALYTKLSALLLLPLPLIALRHQQARRNLRFVVLAYAVVFAGTIPLWLRNINAFGSFMPLEAGFGAAAFRIPDWVDLSFTIRSLIFPWHELWYGVAGLVLMVPLLCIMTWSLISRINLRMCVRAPVMPIAALLVLASFIWLNMRYDQAEARYLFAAWPALAVGVSRPFNRPALLWLLVLAYMLPYLLMVLSFAY